MNEPGRYEKKYNELDALINSGETAIYYNCKGCGEPIKYTTTLASHITKCLRNDTKDRMLVNYILKECWYIVKPFPQDELTDEQKREVNKSMRQDDDRRFE